MGNAANALTISVVLEYLDRAAAGMAGTKQAIDGIKTSTDGLKQTTAALTAEQQALGGALERAHSGVTRLQGAADGLKQVFDGLKQFAGGVKDAVAGLTDLRRPAEEANNSLSTMVKSGAAALGALSLGGLARLSDEYSGMAAKVKLVSDGTEGFTKSLGEVQGIAVATGTSVTATGDLYATLTRTLADMGKTGTSVAAITTTVSQALQLSGGSAESSAGALMQLSQALASGVLRGDEFNSIMEGAPRLARALSDQLGVNVGALRAMAEAGKLTADVIVNALTGQAAKLGKEFETLPATFGRSMTQLVNTLTTVVGRLTETSGAARLFAQVVGILQQAIEAVGSVLGTFLSGVQVLANAFDGLPGPLQKIIIAWGLWQASGIGIFDILSGIASALLSLALAVGSAVIGWYSFLGTIKLASLALQALWALAVANPLGAIVAVLGLAAAAFLAFSESNAEASQRLGELREKTMGQVDEITKLRAAMDSAAPGSKAYNAAAERLAEIVPGLTLSMDEQGRMVARVGAGYEANTAKVEAYVAGLKKTDQTAMLDQLVLAFQDLQDSSAALADKKEWFGDLYGSAQKGYSGLQGLRNLFAEYFGLFPIHNKTLDALKAKEDAAAGSVQKFAVQALNSGMSIRQITERLTELGYGKEQIQGITDKLLGLTEEAGRSGTGLSRSQQAVGAAGLEAARAVGAATLQVGAAVTELDKKLETHQKALDAALRAEAANWKELGIIQRSAFDEQMAAIDRVEAANTARAARGNIGERARAVELIKLTEDAAAARLTTLAQYSSSALALVDQESNRRIEAARRTGGDVRLVEMDILRLKQTALTQIEGDYKKHIDSLNQDERRHLSEVTRIQNELRQLQMTTEDRIRELKRGAMTDTQAYYDRDREALEKLAAARQAATQGQLELARKLAQEGMDLAASNSRAVEDGGRKVVSQQEATARAIEIVTAGAKIQAATLREGMAAERDHAAEAAAAAKEAQQGLAGIAQGARAIKAELAQAVKLDITWDSQSLDLAKQSVDELVRGMEPLANAKDYLKQAADELASFSGALANAGTLARDNPIVLQATTQALDEKLKEVKIKLSTLGPDVPPELTLSVKAASDAVNGVQTAIRGLETPTASEHTVATNVPEVAKSIDSLDGRDTASTHTITVVKVEGNALGGLIQRFAGGGQVDGFAVPSWTTVPGVGNEDSVPAGLSPGMFVLRKAAAGYYGGLLDRLAAVGRFAAGGLIPSLLMPGERLFAPGTVSRLGAGLFEGLNAMRIPRAQLAAALDGATAPVARFAAGGGVGAVSAAGQATARPDTVHINVNYNGQRIGPLAGSRDQAQALAAMLRDLARAG
ncbi:tape measure protein [uncultured Thiodictyon sp.]|uniref:tape measure protein n=1 Tax=uncultured Thiodictyon sp. TaxID=1846217 RepID=UPI0025FDBA57|nr:tape measure protein [uncultured Thiodictyon sp.]